MHRGENMPICRSPQPHPSTPHTPDEAGPPRGPSQLSLWEGRPVCVVASVPLGLQQKPLGAGQGGVARPGSGSNAIDAVRAITNRR